MFRYKLQVPNLILIILCLVILVSIFLLNAFDNVADNKESVSVRQLQSQDSVVLYLQKSKDDLYWAENDYHFYLGTQQDTYKVNFISKIENFIDNIDKAKILDDTTSNSLVINIQKRVALATSVIKLKELADNILANSLEDSSDNPNYTALANAPATRVIEKHFTQTRDTIKYVPVKKKKTLIKKIISIFKDSGDDSLIAIANKTAGVSNVSKTDSIYQERRKSSKAGDVTKNYYKNILQQELALRKNIDEKNKLTALYNKSIFTNLQDQIVAILNDADSSRKDKTYSTLTQMHRARSSQTTLFNASLIVICILIIVLGYKAFKAQRYEKNILLDKDQAIALSKMKAAFLNTMSHEIRTPLTAIVGFAEHINQNGINDNTIQLVNNIKYASDHLLETVNEILEFSRLENGRIKVTNENFSLSELLVNVVGTYQLQAEKKSLDLSLKSSLDKSQVVTGDAFHLRQILFNLINNAIKFTEKGSITLTAVSELKPDNLLMVHFVVADTGIGIQKEAIDTIFNEFVQIKDFGERQHKHISGTGLGLAITRKLIHELNGTIKLSSELGKGSKFTISLPFTLSNSKLTTPSVPKTENASLSLQGKKILLAEDSELIIHLATAILKDYHLDIQIAKNGEEAWELFVKNEGQFDFVLTDIQMPKLSGNDLAKRIRQSKIKKADTVAIIAMTANTSLEEYEAYRKDGMNDVITKPFKGAELRDMLLKFV